MSKHVVRIEIGGVARFTREKPEDAHLSRRCSCLKRAHLGGVVFETEEHLRAKSVLALSLIDDAQGED
jgi:hypothetical protein